MVVDSIDDGRGRGKRKEDLWSGRQILSLGVVNRCADSGTRPAKPIFQARTETGDIHFPFSADHNKDWQDTTPSIIWVIPSPLDFTMFVNSGS